MKAGVIIAAAGSGTRMGGTWKALLHIGGKTALQYCLDSFAKVDNIAHIVLVVPADVTTDHPLLPRGRHVSVVQGGAQRADSVRAGLSAMPPELELIVVHD